MVLTSGGSLDCGAEALHAVMHYHGDGPSLEELSNDLYVPDVEGTFPQLLIQTAHRHGFAARTVEGSPQALMAAIDAGVPPVILARLKPESNHFMIPTGYASQGESFVFAFYHGHQWILTRQELEEIWRPCGFVQMEFVPDPQATLLAQAHLLERGGHVRDALPLYLQVLASSPERVEARLGAGNCLALQGDVAGARAEYLLALESGAQDPELFNNLADVSLSLGDHGEEVLCWATAAVEAFTSQHGQEPSVIHEAVLARKLALALGTLGSVHLARGETSLAHASFQRSLELLPAQEVELRRRRLAQLAASHQTP